MPSHGDGVICHNDFAPYNLVFRDGALAGAIDFDTASPGTRLWDIAYLAYRAVPLNERDLELSIPERRARLQRLLDAYGSDATIDELAQMAVARLIDLADFTDERARETGRTDLPEHAALYRRDAASLPALL
jgi:Ser/Thr protein kinase RdoA (MazF antagonist)